MLTVPSGDPSAATLPAPFDSIVTLLTALPLGSWMWVAVAIATLFGAAHLTRQRTPIVTLADHLDEIDSEVQS